MMVPLGIKLRSNPVPLMAIYSGKKIHHIQKNHWCIQQLQLVVIILKESINMENLESIQYLNFNRKYTVKDRKSGKERQVEDIIESKIRGVGTISGSKESIPSS